MCVSVHMRACMWVCSLVVAALSCGPFAAMLSDVRVPSYDNIQQLYPVPYIERGPERGKDS